MSQNAITLADITSADWSLCLDKTAGGTSGAGIGKVVQGIADVEQCMAIILTTPLGSDPFRPTFGIDAGLLDKPLTQSASAIVAAVTAAIAAWEPRAEVISVNVALSSGNLTVTIEWQLVSMPSSSATTQITL